MPSRSDFMSLIGWGKYYFGSWEDLDVIMEIGRGLDVNIGVCLWMFMCLMVWCLMCWTKMNRFLLQSKESETNFLAVQKTPIKYDDQGERIITDLAFGLPSDLTLVSV